MTVKSLCGAILISREPETLARFYGEALGLKFEREEHGDLAPHWGVDIGSVHFGIHPPDNFKAASGAPGAVTLAFDVDSLPECQGRLERLGAACLIPPHDEGFGKVALFRDPQGNLFELVELDYAFGSKD